MSAAIPKLAYTVDEVTAATGIGRSSIYEDLSAGLLKARKRGRTTIILAEDLAAWLAAMPAFGEAA